MRFKAASAITTVLTSLILGGCSLDIPVGEADAMLVPLESDIVVGSRQDLVATACQERLTLSIRASAASAVTAAALTALGRVDALFYAADVNAGLRCRSVGEVQGITMPSHSAFTLEQTEFVHTATLIADDVGEVTLTGTVANGEDTLTASANVRAHAPDGLAATVRCVDENASANMLVPSGSVVEVELSLMAGDVALGGYGYEVPLDVIGADVVERSGDDARTIVLDLAAGGPASLSSSIDPAFGVTLEGFAAADFDGADVDNAPALQRIGERVVLTYTPTVAGARPCQYPSDAPTLNATSDTPDVCTVTTTNPFPGPAAVTVTGVSGGRCRVLADYGGFAAPVVEYDVRGFEELPPPDVELGHSLAYRALWASGADSVFVLGEDREGSAPNVVSREQQIMHYDGAVWTTTTTSVAMAAIHGLDDSSVYAVGAMGTILHYDGASWTPMTSGTDVSLSAVFTTPDGWTLAAGGPSGTLLELAPGGWQPVALPMAVPQAISEIWGDAADNVFVGTAQGLLLHFDGSMWAEVTHPVGGVGAIFGLDTGELYVGGTSLQVFDGDAWTTLFTLEDGFVYDIWGSSPRDMFAIGYAGNSVGAPFAQSNDGGAWTALDHGQSGGVGRNILGFSASDAVFALTSRALLIYPR